MNWEYSKNRIRVHLAFWCFMVLFIFDYHWFETSIIEALLYTLLEVVGYLFIFYANFLILGNRIFKHKLAKSLIASFSLAIVYIAFLRLTGFEHMFYEFEGKRNLFSMGMNTTLFIGLSYMAWYIEDGIRQRELLLKLEVENRLMQTEVLKNRINPHFIFNTLNNLYALINRQDTKVQEMVTKLSNVLRYAADDGSQNYIPITKEVQHLKSYIDLILMQEPRSERVDFYTEGIEEYIKIIPFVLITFLENAFKHGDLKNNAEGYIDVSIIVGETFEFDIKNSKSERKRIAGTGLDNIRKQLDIAYEKAYTLDVKDEREVYHLNLSIPVSKMTGHAV